MWFENFERHRANELEEQGAKRYNLNMDEAEREANPTDLPKEKLEAQEKQREKQEKQQEKRAETREFLQNTEHPERQAEVQRAEQQLDSDMWPPISFDDTDSYAQAQIGSTEGGKSLSQRDK